MRSLTHPEDPKSFATHLNEGFIIGVVLGEITDVRDPLQQGRVRCRSQLFSEYDELPSGTDGWIPVMVDYVLSNRAGGKVNPLQVGTQVVLSPVMGKTDNWVVLGAMHSSVEPPHPAHDLAKNIVGELNPDGTLEAKDLENSSRVKTYPHGVTEIVTPTGDTIVKTAAATVTYSASGKIDLENAFGTVSVTDKGEIAATNASGNSITLDSKGEIGIKAGASPQMTFGADGVTLLGPRPEAKSEIEKYRTNVQQTMGSFDKMFGELSQIDLSKLDAKSIEATIGKISTALNEAKTVVNNFEAGVKSIEELSQQPIEQIVDRLAPQVRTYLENKLQDTIPKIESWIDEKLDAKGLSERLTGLAPTLKDEVTPAKIQPLLTNLKHDRKLLIQSLVSQIVPGGFDRVANTIAGPAAEKLPQILATLNEPIVNFTDDPQAAITSGTGWFDLPLATATIPELSYLSPTAVYSEIEKKQILSQILPKYSKQLAEWHDRARKTAKIEKAIALLPSDLSASERERILSALVTADSTQASAETLLANLQQILAARHQGVANKIKTLVDNVTPLSEATNDFDRGDYSSGIARIVALGAAGSGLAAIDKLAAEVNAIDTPKVDNRVDDRILLDLENQLLEIVTKYRELANAEDADCAATLKATIDKLDRGFKAILAKIRANNSFDAAASAISEFINGFIAANRDLKIAYPRIELLWVDLRKVDRNFAKLKAAAVRRNAVNSIASIVAANRDRAKVKRTDTQGLKQFLANDNWQPSETVGKEDAIAIVAAWQELLERERALDKSIQENKCDRVSSAIVTALAAEIDYISQTITVDYDKQFIPPTYKDLAALKGNFVAAVAGYVDTEPHIFAISGDLDALLVKLKQERQTIARKKRLEELVAAYADLPRIDNASLSPQSIGRTGYGTIAAEFERFKSRQTAALNFSDPSGYPQIASYLIGEIDRQAIVWRVEWQQIDPSDPVKFAALADLRSTMDEVFLSNQGLTNSYGQLNLLWDDLNSTLDYLISATDKTTLASGDNSQSRGILDRTLPGVAANPATSSPLDPWAPIIEVVKAINDGILQFFPDYRQMHDRVNELVNAVPKSAPTTKMTFGAKSVEVTTKGDGSGAKMTLDGDRAKIAAANSASSLDLGSGTAKIDTGFAGGKLELSPGSGVLKGGDFGGMVSANAAGASLSSLGGAVSLGVGAGGLMMASPWGSFGFGSTGLGMLSKLPLQFRTQDTDYYGGSSGLSLSPDLGAGLVSYEQFNDRPSAEVVVKDGIVKIKSYSGVYDVYGPLGRNSLGIEVRPDGVYVEGYRVSELYSYLSGVYGRLAWLEGQIASLGDPRG